MLLLIFSAPSSLQDFSIFDKNTTAVKLTWDYGKGVREYVTVCVEAGECYNITTNETTTIISDLTAGKTYSFSNTAVSNDVLSVSSEIGPVNLGKIL